MSATYSLKRSMARSTDAVLHVIQHSLMIVGLVLIFSFVTLVTKHHRVTALPDQGSNYVLSQTSVPDSTYSAAPEAFPESPPVLALSPRMQGALDYVTRRYRVSPDALVPVFEVAQLVGQERRVDPLLIVAIIGIESKFNPFAESAMGARGLMQVIPRFHQDKLPEGSGEQILLDPATNIRVGVDVLTEAIQRRGSLIAGLQYYAGSSEPDGNYASKVLAEKDRLEQAARRSMTTATAAVSRAPNAPDA